MNKNTYFYLLFYYVYIGDQILEYKYEIDGCASSTIFPDGKTQEYVLDSYSRIISETNAAQVTTNTKFDGYGRADIRTRKDDSIQYEYGMVNNCKVQLTGVIHKIGSNTYNKTFTYDGFGQCKEAIVKDGKDNVILNVHYGRDDSGRLTDISSTGELEFIRKFEYDGLDQLVSDSTEGGNTDIFSYDGNYNIIKYTHNYTTTNYNYNSDNQREDLKYDTMGRLLQDEFGRSYYYDCFDKVVNVVSPSGSCNYKYYPNGALAQREDTHFYYSNDVVNAIHEHNETWTSFLFEEKNRCVAYKNGETPMYYIDIKDSLSIIQQDNNSTAITYEAYGASVAYNNKEEEQQFGWQQELYDASSGLVYLRSRFYHPSLRTFVSMDNNKTENRYAYCRGNPYNFVDPTGHLEKTAIAGITLAVSTVVSIGTAGVGALAISAALAIAETLAIVDISLLGVAATSSLGAINAAANVAKAATAIASGVLSTLA